MRRDDQSNRAVYARKFFDNDGIFQVAQPGAAILFRENNSKQSHLAKLWNDFLRKLRSFVPLHDVRRYLSFGKLPHRSLKVLLLIR